MDDSLVVESSDASDVRSGSLGEKRPLENGLDRDLSNKKAKRVGEDVKSVSNVKKVAEIVLVLATMGKMRAGRKPTAVEVKMMAEARERLADVCKEFAPKDIFPRDAFGTVIEDLGLNRLREHKLGIRSPKLSISERLQVTKQKMEKSEVFPLHNNSNVYTPPRTQSNLSGTAESRGTLNAGRMFPSDKTNVTSGSFQHPSNEEIEASGFAGISSSTLAGNVSLSKLTIFLNWSKIGTLHMTLVQVLTYLPASWMIFGLETLH